MKKFMLLSALGAAMFIAGNALAVMGTLTVSGTAEFQSFTTNKVIIPGIKKNSFSQKNLLYILEQGTGDTSITNKPTTIFFDPDALNTNVVAWFEQNGGVGDTPYYGIFYYSNSVSGLVKLDGVTNGNYYSYMEFDYTNALSGAMEDFWNPGGMAANNVYSGNSAGSSYTENGNAILYAHSGKYQYNLLGVWSGGIGSPSSFYYANSANNGFQQTYAVVFQGPITFDVSTSQSKDKTTESESFTLKGTGDLNYDVNNATISGTVTFSGKGTDNP